VHAIVSTNVYWYRLVRTTTTVGFERFECLRLISRWYDYRKNQKVLTRKKRGRKTANATAVESHVNLIKTPHSFFYCQTMFYSRNNEKV